MLLTTTLSPLADGFRHEAAIFATDDELTATVVPFLLEGLSASEPTILSVEARQQRLISMALGNTAGLIMLPHGEHYGHPARALSTNHEIFTRHQQGGARRVRVIAGVPHCGDAWERWSTYEAVVNHYFAALSLWGICLYDAREASAEVLEDVLRLHPALAAPGATHLANESYIDPASFLAQRASKELDPLESLNPEVVLLDPPPQAARIAIEGIARHAGLSADELDGLLLSVSEVVTNALLYGRSPVRVEARSTAQRVLVRVHDSGPGPNNPFAGLIPPEQEALGGRGLWIAHQMCRRMALSATPDGFTVRLIAGRTDSDPETN